MVERLLGIEGKRRGLNEPPVGTSERQIIRRPKFGVRTDGGVVAPFGAERAEIEKGKAGADRELYVAVLRAINDYEWANGGRSVRLLVRIDQKPITAVALDSPIAHAGVSAHAHHVGQIVLQSHGIDGLVDVTRETLLDALGDARIRSFYLNERGNRGDGFPARTPLHFVLLPLCVVNGKA
jgi:hypothetical protein